MIVEYGLAPKLRPNLHRLCILLFTDGLTAVCVLEFNLWWEARLDKAVTGVHVFIWVDLHPEMEIELLICRVGELSAKKLELVHPTSTKILADLLE